MIDPSCGTVAGPAVGSSSCDSQGGREWEGLASTDYFTIEPQGVTPNPDIAVGPDDIVTVVNRIIARYPNPNAPSAPGNEAGTASVAYNPAGTNFFPPTSRQFLDVWLGETALHELCPTQPRSNATCVVDNASVRYDQMQGRFVVLFTVVDNARVGCFGCSTTVSSAAGNAGLTRKASWVLISSRWATGCQGTSSNAGVNIGGGDCTPSTPVPAVPGLPGNSEFFTTPQPPGPSQGKANSGGINGNWVSYYGTPDGSCDAACRFGNINSISDSRVAGFQGPATAVNLDCTNTAYGTTDTTTVCYMPSSARLGLDNDNIYIASSVINDNVAVPSRGWTQAAPTQTSLAFEGTRLRVLKKAAVYTGVTSVATGACSLPICPGAAQAASPVQGDFYDLWGNSGRPYAFDGTVSQPVLNAGTRTVSGLHYEPEHLRGRALASYSGNGNVAIGAKPFYAIWGTVDHGVTLASASFPPQTTLYHREVTYTTLYSGTLGANVAAIPNVVNSPKIQGAIPSLGPLASHQVPAFTNPDAVTQQAKLAQTGTGSPNPTPKLYVGDDRPQRVISREGHRYIARAGSTSLFGNFSGTTSPSTVIYDIVQLLTSGGTSLEVYNTQWGNGSFWGPMFDTPANVVQYGAVSPINVQPFLEKLFVGTAYPALAPTDPRKFAYGLISGQALASCKGQEPSVGATTSQLAYPGLFDIRCGEDAYDTPISARHATTGSFTPSDFQINFGSTEGTVNAFTQQIFPMGTRGGAATDPNNMGLWLYGAYSKARLASVPGFGQWGTYVAHYPLTFPLRDPYNNTTTMYCDAQPVVTDSNCAPVSPAQLNPYFTFIQIAKQTDIVPGSRVAPPSSLFNPSGTVLRQDMAQWVVRAQMDENAVTNYLNATGGIFCSFADVSCPGSSGTVTNTTGATSNGWRWIELMYRRGYTKGCNGTTDAQRRFCPTDNLTRGQMAAFIIRAKMNSVFPTATSGAATTASCEPTGTSSTVPVGDQFGLYAGCTPYFGDVASTHTFFSFIQKMRELRISNGTVLANTTTGVAARYSPEDNLTRAQLMTFLVRAFFP